MVISLVTLSGTEWFFSAVAVIAVIKIAKLVIDVIPFA